MSEGSLWQRIQAGDPEHRYRVERLYMRYGTHFSLVALDLLARAEIDQSLEPLARPLREVMDRDMEHASE